MNKDLLQALTTGHLLNTGDAFFHVETCFHKMRAMLLLPSK